ncbi:SH3 domain-containing protein [Butyrivibrio sp. AE2005]|uniref:SH3 domain-containing protein n=1 Tax=Butyrivibrio sp. AE2005 TaxID=1496722 RepID=UPI00047CEBB2|nr:SH3 domain-containing protein [Butyrivibrio sp. AE2005]
MKRKKKNQSAEVRNVRHREGSFFSDNKNIFMPIIFFAAAFVTVAVSYKANLMVSNSALKAGKASMGGSNQIEESALEECTDPDIINLISRYYTAIIEGNADEVNSIYKGFDNSQGIKAEALSEIIERYDSIRVYTKPGPVPNSYIAFIYQLVKLADYDEALPGLETLYICTNTENGELYICGDTDDQTVIEYVKALNAQADVIDLNNKVSSEYNEILNSDESLSSFLAAKSTAIKKKVEDGLEDKAKANAAIADEKKKEEWQNIDAHQVRIIRATDIVNIRASDSTEAEVIEKTEIGKEYQEIEKLPNGWSKISYERNGETIEAYVKSEYFELIDDGTGADDEQSEDAANDASSESTDNSAEDSSSDKKDTDDKNTDTKDNKSDGKGETKTVNGDSVRLRSGQGTDSAILTSMDKGATVKVLENLPSGWSKVEYEGQTGYIKSEFIDQ